MTDIAPTFVNRCTDGLRAAAHAAVDFVYPLRCPFCGGEVERCGAPSTFDPELCAECRNIIAPAIEHACRICAAPVGPFLDTTEGCVHCHQDRFRFEKVVSLGVYADDMKTACLRIKTARGRPLAAALAGLLWERQRHILETAGFDCVVPVPNHWTRRFGSEGNAAETLAESLARRLQVDFGRHILAKVRRTPRQSSLLPHRRRNNLRRAFRVRDRKVLPGATVLLVDDILTTGTTANEIARELKKAGADRVLVAVTARGIGR